MLENRRTSLDPLAMKLAVPLVRPADGFYLPVNPTRHRSVEAFLYGAEARGALAVQNAAPLCWQYTIHAGCRVPSTASRLGGSAVCFGVGGSLSRQEHRQRDDASRHGWH